MIRPADVYLDHCPEIYDAQPGETPEEAEANACAGCPIGGGLECPGVWRWRRTNAIVTQADLEGHS